MAARAGSVADPRAHLARRAGEPAPLTIGGVGLGVDARRSAAPLVGRGTALQPRAVGVGAVDKPVTVVVIAVTAGSLVGLTTWTNAHRCSADATVDTARNAVARRDRAIDRRRTRSGVGVGPPGIAVRIGGSHVAARIGGARVGRHVARRRLTGCICAISARIGAAVVDRAVEGNADITPVVVFGRGCVIAVTGRAPIFDWQGPPVLLERRQNRAASLRESRRKEENEDPIAPHRAHGSRLATVRRPCRDPRVWLPRGRLAG